MIFSYQFLLNKYNIIPKGIIHIGAHKAEESTIYSRNQTEKVLWIEGNPDLIKTIENNISIYPNNKVYRALLSDTENKEINFNITNSSMSSSILELGTHKQQYPDIKVEKKIKLNSLRFDNFIKKNEINILEYNFINIDIQGAELSVLKGFGTYLDNIDYVYTEVNIDTVYEGCPLLDEIDEFLTMKGFQRVELSLKYKSWGDAFYIRKKTNNTEKQKNILESKKIIREFKENKNKTSKKPSMFYRGIRKIYRKFFSKKIKIEPSLIEAYGEKEFAFKLLKVYIEHEKIILFDIGANVGEYSEMLIRHCNKLEINYQLHLFEPQKKCFEVLSLKFKENPNIIINNVAISNQNGYIDFYMEENGASSSSMYDREVFDSSEKVQVKTIRLDDYFAQHNLVKIHFMKIDVEGHELEVLKSVKNNFKNIENIQFEYGGTYLDSKSTLKEAYILLRDYFHIGKIEPNGVNFRPYISEMEDYKYSNYIAEKKGLSYPPINYNRELK